MRLDGGLLGGKPRNRHQSPLLVLSGKAGTMPQTYRPATNAAVFHRSVPLMPPSAWQVSPFGQAADQFSRASWRATSSGARTRLMKRVRRGPHRMLYMREIWHMSVPM
ncbi:hypothetical protein J3459_012203 [Metarhizium acridum]|nr:hypothetical protein J3459_012203 [Metarhizium acridum]